MFSYIFTSNIKKKLEEIAANKLSNENPEFVSNQMYRLGYNDGAVKLAVEILEDLCTDFDILKFCDTNTENSNQH